MKIELSAAEDLAARSLSALGYSPEQSRVIVPHLLDCELRGLGFSGLARIVSIDERLAGSVRAEPITMTRESPVSAQIDGGDNIGYLVGQRATDIVVDKARATGIGIVGASRTWYTGMLSYFAEQITAAGFVAMIASNASAWVAPFGGSSPTMGTNPICFAFPTGDVPVVWDIGISEVIHAQAVLADRTGQTLPEGAAYDSEGEPTVDPVAALGGAFAAWGGHRGSGLGIAVQLLGVLAGSPALPGELRDFGFLVVAIDPGLFGDRDDFRARVVEYGEAIAATRPLDASRPVRLPFARSAAERDRRRREGAFDVAPEIVESLKIIADRPRLDQPRLDQLHHNRPLAAD